MGLFRKKPKPEERAWDTSFNLPARAAASYAGPVVTQDTALGISSFWRCVQLVSDSIAQLPLHDYKNGTQIDTPSLLERPNPLETRQETIFSMVASLLMHGNAVAILGGFDRNAYPQVLYPVDVRRVTLKFEDGRYVYVIDQKHYEREEVLHIKGFCLPGEPVGIGVVQAQYHTLGHATALSEYAQRWFSESAVPPGAIKFPDDVTAEEATDFKRNWVLAHGGGNREPAILPNGADFVEYGLTPEVSQFIESRQLSASEVCNLFGVPHSFLGLPGDTRTYSNTEQDSLNFVKFCLGPWITRLERAFSDLLPRGQEAKFNLDALLRADTTTRYAAHAVALSNGFLTLDEVRELENRKPLPKQRKPQEAEATEPEAENDE